ncbi:MAG: M14 family murein peptide amidase A [bacterium]
MNIINLKNLKTKSNNIINLLKADKAGNDLNALNILFIGVFHGDEPEGFFLINKFIDFISENNSFNFKNNLYFIPQLNPDGKELNQRTNINGVDLNRNFPTKNWELSTEKDNYYSGESPASEIETQFMADVIEEINPDIILSIHNPYKIVNFDGPAKQIAEEISKITDYPVQDDIGYPTPGSFGTYCGIERNIKTITLELPDNQDIDELWNINKDVFIYLVNI